MTSRSGAVLTFPDACRESLADGVRRVFGDGFDRGFKIMLALSLLVGGLALAWRHPEEGVLAIAFGFVAMAINIALPFIVVTIFCTASALILRLACPDRESDAPLPVVIGALVVTVLCVVAISWGLGHIPVVGAQLRGLFI